METLNNFDVIIIGAGISGINAAYRLQTESPDHSYAILEARGNMGGTWDLFKYPGIRSDSDLHTFGFPFRPWVGPPIAEAPAIKQYMEETASAYGIDRHIQYHHKMTAANWSSDQQSWQLTVTSGDETKYYHARFILFATGYYNYDEALPANIPGIDTFEGLVVHPQFWPTDLDYADKKIVIIGSGATAITLLPNLAKTAAKVTMLQRSPSYILSLPQKDPITYWSRRLLPESWAYRLTRARFLVLPLLFFKFCRAFPNAARRLLQKGAAKQLPPGYPIKPNLDPAYGPWEQRLGISPNGDFYKAIRDGKADIVTGHIKQITEKSIVVAKNSGGDGEEETETLDPDIIITATGLKILIGGGATISVDHTPVTVADKYVWKGLMLSDVPNAAVVIGYTNASWTLGADATALSVTRLLNYMKKNGYVSATPTVDAQRPMGEQPVLNLNSTYIVRAKGALPKTGDRAPWLPRSTYFSDLWQARFGSLTRDMRFERVKG